MSRAPSPGPAETRRVPSIADELYRAHAHGEVVGQRLAVGLQRPPRSSLSWPSCWPAGTAAPALPAGGRCRYRRGCRSGRSDHRCWLPSGTRTETDLGHHTTSTSARPSMHGGAVVSAATTGGPPSRSALGRTTRAGAPPARDRSPPPGTTSPCSTESSSSSGTRRATETSTPRRCPRARTGRRGGSAPADTTGKRSSAAEPDPSDGLPLLQQPKDRVRQRPPRGFPRSPRPGTQPRTPRSPQPRWRRAATRRFGGSAPTATGGAPPWTVAVQNTLGAAGLGGDRAAGQPGGALAQQHPLGRREEFTRDPTPLDAGADEHLLAPMLIGSAHLLFADREGPAPSRVRRTQPLSRSSPLRDRDRPWCRPVVVFYSVDSLGSCAVSVGGFGGAAQPPEPLLPGQGRLMRATGPDARDHRRSCHGPQDRGGVGPGAAHRRPHRDGVCAQRPEPDRDVFDRSYIDHRPTIAGRAIR